eukprot:CAMPEP_0185804128 /NCGR_PEP_ID=MMETSP1322-20130828/3074_1 /TAXON_ID=265543 /ORGANISM="Minutocellus polymorphus, Strain RCC2270" /LENGTH=305 /DNA_ID=CAMNT_0028500085 /DNA_START=88 /DNA_END=1005 /DNA_ORIENTATION=+
MISSVSSRALLPNLGRIHTARQFSSVAPPNGSQNKQTKKNSESSNAKRELHNSAHSKADALKAAVENPPFMTASSGLAKRFVATAEVTVSKIFPAGFGWQTSSIIAENHLGYAADSAAFALTTGLGDAVGVLAGHTAYYAAKKATVDSSIDMEREAHVGVLLGSAAFCSGTAWQPLVDALQGAELSFMQVFAGTWVGCGTAFYLGLRAARTILSGPFKYIQEPTYENSKTDMSLSSVIGGATAFFAGTDAAYLPSQNFLIDVVGIADGTPDIVGCAIAGTSTSMGFATSQTALNVIFPAGKCWND